MPAAEPRGELDDLRALRADDDLRVRRAVLDPERGRSLPRGLDRRSDVRRRERARPDVRERDAERGRIGAHAVGHGERVEAPVERERVDRHLLAVDQLLDEARLRPRSLERCVDRRRKRRLVLDEREPALALPVRRLHDAREAEPLDRGARLREALGDLGPRLRDAGFAEALALLDLRDRELRDLRRERVREREPLRDAGRDGDRPVDPGRDHAVDPLGLREPLDPRLVLGRDDRAAIREREAGRGGIAVDRDHEQVQRACGLEQPELRGAGA